MDWITEQLAIGNYLEAQDAALLKQNAIRSVVSLEGTLGRDDAERSALAEIASYRLIDGPGNDLRIFRWAVDDLRRLVDSHSPVLVQCHAGRSRSAIVVAAFLMQAAGLEAEAAVAAVAARREINITPQLLSLLQKL